MRYRLWVIRCELSVVGVGWRFSRLLRNQKLLPFLREGGFIAREGKKAGRVRGKMI